MNLYIKKNMEVNSIFRQYVADEDLLIYSIDESILKVTKSLNLFTTPGTRSERRKQLARWIQLQLHVYRQTGLIAIVGIGDNPVLAKLALDNETKHNKGFIAEWTYQNVPEKIWAIKEMTDFWGIGSRMKKRLNYMEILSIKDLANLDPYALKRQLEDIGLQLYFHANGVARTDIAEPTKEKSYGDFQVLPKDYTRKEEVEIVVKEMAEQVAARIRQHNCF
ncbi:DNA polymerase V [Enterococcus pernyi]